MVVIIALGIIISLLVTITKTLGRINQQLVLIIERLYSDGKNIR